MTYYTLYKTVLQNGEVTIDYSPESGRNDVCFSTYKRSAFGTKTVYLYILKDYTNKNYSLAENLFSCKQVVEYIERLSKYFPCKLEEKESYYQIVLQESDYINQVHIRIFFDFVRALWEKGPNLALKNYFKIAKNIRDKYCVLTLMQISSLKDGGGQSHPLPSAQSSVACKFKVLSWEEIEKALKGNDYDSTFSIWNSISSQKFEKYIAQIPNAKRNILTEKLTELKELVINSDKAFNRAMQIANPLPLDEIAG